MQKFEGLFRCADGSMFFASGDSNLAKVTAFSKTWELPNLQAASGMRYGNDEITFWINGDTAQVQRKNVIEFGDCTLTHSNAEAADKDALNVSRSGVDQSGRNGVITGTVIYAERVDLRPTSVLIVQLHEWLSPDASPTLIAEQEYPVKHQPRHPKRPIPLEFKLEYKTDSVRPSSRYQLSARIQDQGRVLFVTDTPTPVITGYPNQVDLQLRRVQFEVTPVQKME
jgi:putative lipoprotein